MERDYVSWPTARLEHEYTRLAQHEAEPYLTDARRQETRDTMAHIAFEGLMRQREFNEQEAITGQLELNYLRVM